MIRDFELIPGLTVSDQISVADVATLAARGVKTLIRNRPDHEEPGQLDGAAIAAAAAAHGITFIDQPVSFSTLRAGDGVAFNANVHGADAPIHAFCRTGRRCVALWALANAPTLGTTAVLRRAADVGEDLRGLAPLLAEVSAA